MIKFVRVVSFFGLLLALTFATFIFLADGSTDAMYLKLTTSQKTSLILGGSRASQGIQPTPMRPVLNQHDLYNYAFQNPSSPYGDVYLNSIKKKIMDSSQSGLFILEVNPWNMTDVDGQNGEDSKLSEAGNFLAKTTNVNSNPNLEYFFKSFDQSFTSIVERRMKKGQDETYFIEDDGWVHVIIEPDSLKGYMRTKNKIKKYERKSVKLGDFSKYRRLSLIKTIRFLKKYGQVYLVRIPVSPEMLILERKLLPDFDTIIDSIAIETNSKYINKMPFNNEYEYTDGNHLDVDSGRRFSIDLANTIKNLPQNEKIQ